MKTSITLFTILAITALHGQALATSADPSLSGVPLNVARDIVHPMPTASANPAVDVAKSGVPLFTAKLATQPAAGAATSQPVNLAGVTMRRATWQATGSQQPLDAAVALAKGCGGAKLC